MEPPPPPAGFSDDLYKSLRQLAGQMFSREAAGSTLQPTAIVHEAYLRLADADLAEWRSATHFRATAARTMRRVLIDAARRRQSDKRGGGLQRVTLHDESGSDVPQDADLQVLEDALERLGKQNERYLQIVEMRFFGGLSVEDIAGVLGISDRMVRLEWAKARSWLSLYLEKPQP